MNNRSLKYALALASVLTLSAGSALAQATAPAAATDTNAPATAEETITLTPFEVTSDKDVGYSASATLAGNRLSTELRDVGSSVSVVTEQFMKDIGATDNKSLLQYTAGTEVGSIQGNYTGVGNGQKVDEGGTFQSPNSNTRVRGLAAADNTRDYFMTNIPWDGYNIDRVELQRGPNSILFGQGSPAGIINNSTKSAAFKNSGEAELRVDSNGSVRSVLNINRQLLKNELAIRVIGLDSKEQYQQKPAFEQSKRLYGALRYEPKILNRDGVTTVIKVNAERGNIDANRPRAVTPVDYITPFFLTGQTNGYNNINRQLFDPVFVQDNNTKIAGHGQALKSFADGTVNTAYIPYLGNFAQNYGGPLAVFNGDSSSLVRLWQPEPRAVGGLKADGSIDGSIGGIGYNRQVGVQEYWRYAQSANLPNSKWGVYKNYHLSDSSIFDFYNNLLDGPNKKEWADFQTANIDITQTYFQGKFGWNFAYDSQKYNDGRLSFLTDSRQGIYIDMMATLIDGSANPNKGRPYISDSIQYGNNIGENDREARRLTTFYTVDFKDFAPKSIIAKALGKHTFTGLFSTDDYKYDNRGFLRYKVDANFLTFTGDKSYTSNTNALNPIIYLGGSLANATTASGAHIPRPTAELDMSATSIYAFNPTWKATSVSPGAEWMNPYWPEGNAQRVSTQSENPANYVGWGNVPVSFIRAEDGNIDNMTTSARMGKKQVSSRGGVWQGQLWDKLLIGNFGIRTDIARSWVLSPAANSITGLVDVSRANYNLEKASFAQVTETSQSWSIVAHVSELLPEKFPLKISLYYNKSENFQPEASRYDIYGNALPLPKGKTFDRGFVISTKDEKFSLKVNKYETRASNASVSGGIANNTWFIGALEAWGGNWANHFEHNLNVTGDMSSANQGNNGKYNYGADVGETPEQAAAREASVIAAWRQHQKNVPKAFYDAWQLDMSKVTNYNAVFKYGSPTFTQDAVSRGYEYEFTANPTKNWRISFNAAKTEAISTNVGGAAFLDFVSIVDKDLAGGAKGTAGDLRIWWGGAGNTTTFREWTNNVGSSVALTKLQEGLATPEIRKWRYNLISNYSFRNGFLKGVGVGGGYRWQDKVLIGYPLLSNSATKADFDIANPYMGPTETNIDLWLNYSRKLWKGIDWQIQLNIRNLTAGNDLIPISSQPDGTPAAYRIAPPRVFTLSNTFKF